MMNDKESITKLRRLLKDYGGWEQIHKASIPDENGILVVKKEFKSGAKKS
jgi:hypothetical protein